ncbi:13507_t:CDS:2 [Entrophospora sp. SA101]|nr:13507_t:CDS:2 [Entrophospora sp. SA101]CAJ0864083.1 2654_t:CDS:2 [Entrophospora sp. SA101]
MTTAINTTNASNTTSASSTPTHSNVRRNRGNIPARLDIPVNSLTPSSSAPSSEIAAALGRITPQPSEEDDGISTIIDKVTIMSVTEESVVDEPVEMDQTNLRELGRLGEGASGTVSKVENIITGEIMAKKKINVVPADENMHRQILRELQFLRTCHSPNIVTYYGAFLEDNNSSIAIIMEYCEGGSLDAIYKNVSSRKGRIGEKVLGKIGESVLKGLVYLYSKQIIHRDIKPSNILVTRKGEIKICDFGVSGKLVGSVAETFLGESYKVSADVWSLGLTIMEVAQNKFPFPSSTPIELVTHIATSPAPKLSDEFPWSENLKDFLRVCLEKDGKLRPTPREMLDHPFIKKSLTKEVDLERWIKEVWEWN